MSGLITLALVVAFYKGHAYSFEIVDILCYCASVMDYLARSCSRVPG